MHNSNESKDLIFEDTDDIAKSFRNDINLNDELLNEDKEEEED